MVTLKGTKDGLLVTIREGTWNEIVQELKTQLDRPRAAEFFRGAQVRLDTGTRALSITEFETLGELFAKHEMQFNFQPTAVPASRMPVPEPPRAVAEPEPSEGENHISELWVEAALVRRTVRAGMCVRYAGDVIVLGDVNPSGEIIAEGDVLIFGKLRGVVHAGAGGNDKACVSALLLAPTQLRIGSYIARAPDERPTGRREPEMASVRDGHIVIESWKIVKD